MGSNYSNLLNSWQSNFMSRVETLKNFTAYGAMHFFLSPFLSASSVTVEKAAKFSLEQIAHDVLLTHRFIWFLSLLSLLVDSFRLAQHVRCTNHEDW